MRKFTDGQLDQLVKARWREIGLSQDDLAEVLGAVPKGEFGTTGDPGRVDDRRLKQLATALGISADSLRRHAGGNGRRDTASPTPDFESLQCLLELRLLRVFRALQDSHTKRMLIELIEQIARRQPPRQGDAS